MNQANDRQKQEPQDCGQTTSPIRCFLQALGRKKPLDGRTDTNLNRCLNLLDLTTLGVGSTLGLGLYVLAGQVASNKAGPGVVISFALAALASGFSALCYAEFAGRVPRAGSAYAYSYITVGEFVAFIIGWNLILEYVIGAASVARGFSGYLRFVWTHLVSALFQDTSTSTTTTKTLIENTSNFVMNSTQANNFNTSHLVAPLATNNNSTQLILLDSVVVYVSKYFDWPSIAIVVVITAFILFGVKESTNVALAFTTVNMTVVLAVVLSSLSSLDLHNWRLSKEEVPPGYGEGGFLPFGWSGVLAGSATCFFGFIGFDTIASSAEEAKNPKRNVPLSILLSLFISFLAYMSVAIVQTLLWPYYDQNNITILPYIFDKLGMPITYWIVLLGAVAGLASSQLGGLYPLPRILYSMAQDRLIYGYLSHVNKRLKLPVRATIVGSVFIACLSCLLDIQDLADMVSIGTLAAYSLVSLSVLIVRYEDRTSDTVDDSNILTSRLSFSDILSVQNKPSSSSFALSPAQHEKSNGQHSQPADHENNNNNWPAKPNLLDKNIKINQLGSTIDKKKPTCKVNRPKLLDLLITWNSEDNEQSDDSSRGPDDQTSRQSKVLISLIVILTIILDILALFLTSSSSDADYSINSTSEPTEQEKFLNPRTILLSIGSIVLVALMAVILMLSRLPVGRPPSQDMFQVPLVPLTPTLSILVNTFLMLNLSYLTWVRFTVWMSVGLFIYFTYGIWNSQGYMLHLD